MKQVERTSFLVPRPRVFSPPVFVFLRRQLKTKITAGPATGSPVNREILALTFSGWKENHFYSLPFGQAEASIY